MQRIFRICDKDEDGRLSDHELKHFQNEVFKGELSQSDIRGIKEVIKQEVRKSLLRVMNEERRDAMRCLVKLRMHGRSFCYY